MWESYLTEETLDWLLEPTNPTVRYLTLTQLLGESPSCPKAIEAQREIMRAGVVPRILAKQQGGAWNEPGRFYRDKYTGTVWQLIILAEHLADGNHPCIRAACESLLECCQDRESFGFSYDGCTEGGGRHSGVIPCLTGNMVFSLIRLGYLHDERVQRGIDWITRYQRFDDAADEAPSGWPYDRFEMCFGKHTCHMGAVKALKALAEVPPRERTDRIEQTIASGREYILLHHIYKRSHDLSKVAKPGWLRLQFPLMYQSDLLETASILLELGCRDQRMSDAIERIASKRTEDGRWLLESTFNGRFQVDIEERGVPSRWMTLRALRVLKRFYG